MTLEELIAQRDRLLSARAQPHRSYEVEGLSVTFRSDTEIAAAIADLDRRIAAAQQRRATVSFNTSKGL